MPLLDMPRLPHPAIAYRAQGLALEAPQLLAPLPLHAAAASSAIMHGSLARRGSCADTGERKTSAGRVAVGAKKASAAVAKQTRTAMERNVMTDAAQVSEVPGAQDSGLWGREA